MRRFMLGVGSAVVENAISDPVLKRAATTSKESQSSNTSSNDMLSSATSFVGNTPSTILFFLALAVGVFIAFLFIFFTIRYFIRSSYGLHVYPITHRNVIVGANINMGNFGGSANNDELTHELHEQLEYIRNHNFIRGDILERRLNNGRRRRRRRGGRYSRMKKLTEQEVEILFPQKTYHDWLNGGRERDHDFRDGVLQEEGLLNSVRQEETVDTNNINTVSDEILITENQGNSLMRITSNNTQYSDTHDEFTNGAIELSDMPSHDKTSVEEKELHFTSGTCAICLDVLESEDIVRGLLCGHVFHSACLDPWLIRRRACCPMCKRDYFYKDPNAAQENEEDQDQNQNQNQNQENQTQDTHQETSQSQDQDQLEDDESFNVFDLEMFRNDPALRAMLRELIPISERVRIILEDENNASLDLQLRGEQLAKETYGGFFKRLWWRLMGIKQDDLFNWAVLKIYRLEGRRPREGTETSETNETSDTNETDQTDQTNQTNQTNPTEQDIAQRV